MASTLNSMYHFMQAKFYVHVHVDKFSYLDICLVGGNIVVVDVVCFSFVGFDLIGDHLVGIHLHLKGVNFLDVDLEGVDLVSVVSDYVGSDLVDVDLVNRRQPLGRCTPRPEAARTEMMK